MSSDMIQNLPIISIIIPLATAFILGLVHFKNKKIYPVVTIGALAVSLICLILLIKPIFINGDIIVYWMGGWEMIGISLEVDPFSLFVGFIISIACLLSSIYAYSYMSKDEGGDKYYVLFLVLCTSMIGFVFTGDLFNMYVMIEIMTFAAIALTAFRNHKYKSIEAGFKYIVSGSLGSSFILIGTVLIYSNLGSLNIADLMVKVQAAGGVSENLVLAVALGFMIVGYAVKSFMVPCHTWPTDAHMSAPSSVSMILSGVMSKTGIYGIVKILFIMFGLTGSKGLSILLAVFGVITMVVGVCMALMQTDFKRLLAFHSVSQIGYIVCGISIGIFTNSPDSNLGLVAAIYHMVNHSIFKGLLFLTAGSILYRVGTTDLSKISGLVKKMPFTTIAFLIGAAGISGLPPFNGFISKGILYEAGMKNGFQIITIIAFVVSALTLASFVKVASSAFFGPLRCKNDEGIDVKEEDIKEVPLAMKIPMAILSALTLIFGIIPGVIIDKIIVPVVGAIRNIGAYVLASFSDIHGFNFVADCSKLGFYKPEVFLLIFVLLLILITSIVMFKPKSSSVIEGSKNASFSCGEEDSLSKLGPHDMFWGFKESYRKYFNGLTEGHSGVVNDYAFWIIAALAITLVYSALFI